MNSNILCLQTQNLLEAWKSINDNTKGFVFIIDEEKKLKGILSDGDIRRFLLNGGSLETIVDKVMNRNFISAKITDSREVLISKINSEIKFIPLLDDENKIVDYFELKMDFNVPIATPDLKGRELSYLVDAFLSTWISSTGEYILRFENGFADFCGCKHGIAVANGTVAIHLALVALGIGKGDEVIVPDLTFAATINTVIHANATPVIVDVEKDSWCISPEEIEKAITPRTKAIIPVHLYGQPCDMEAIMIIAKKYNLYVIEDCAEAHGAEFDGKKVGSFGDISCFSFFGNKVITTGEGGMCLTNNSELNDKMRVLRDHGMSKTRRYWHDVVGYNYRMTNLQAAIGLAQLERIEEILIQRNEIELQFKDKLQGSSAIEFQRHDLSKRKKITWLVSALVTNGRRDELMDKLREIKIDVRPFFYPLGEMDVYKEYLKSNKNSLEISKCGLNFPTNTYITENVLDKIKSILDSIS